MPMQPIIGITIDYSQKELYSKYPWYALRVDYADAISTHGGVPLLLPYDVAAIEQYAQIIDGLLISGGDFDIHPKYYGQDINSEYVVNVIDSRTRFEIALLERAISISMPVLGICGGMQLLNVYSGGSLIQHVPDKGGTVTHQQPHPKCQPHHDIKVQEDSLLHSIAADAIYKVNSTHHQAVDKLGKHLKVSAMAEDGIIEAIEHVSHPYCIGVQWHPEYMRSEQDRNLMHSFVRASWLYKGKKNG
ncbi:MAG: gamma-glutamyl-gamma-aminobutyrate hydrolase family protein [Proteobacteria bacterium]|nr:gamma-glutamyl-gamma-aminobutyrate hydrolase family protein [Pseudomonadota bacterium]